MQLGINNTDPHRLYNDISYRDTKHTVRILSDNDIDSSSSYRVITTELHGAADDHDGDELPAHRAIAEKLPRSAGPHAFGFSLFLQNLIKLAALDVTASQASQSWVCF